MTHIKSRVVYIKFVLSTFIIISACTIHSQDTIQISQAKNYLNKQVTICDIVVETHTSKSEKGPISLNFGNPFPNQTFTAVIFKSDLINFDYDPAQTLIDKNVCISGKITTYKDRLQILIRQSEQVYLNQ